MGGGGIAGTTPGLDRYLLGLAGKERPRVCFLGTASGDDPGYEAAVLRAFVELGAEPRPVRLFQRDIADLGGFLLSQDVICVGGGNTANMLAVWRVHGVDRLLREAWDAGVILAGVSAGANCWFEASTTDSFLIGNADPLADGLGFLPGSFCPHYSSEPARRPRFAELIGEGTLPAGYGADDGVALHFVDTALHATVVADPDAAAYRVERSGASAKETRLSPSVTAG
ncbi:MAG: peptidase E [Acidimicrobiia bacterium]|nr:peptidase E [Acidimicrobiia bacterium]NNF10790.1 peptidase E [Acidimicrobiia bacterium]NNL70390.1 peptidase E [Acidimicrobiia bacterium]